MMGYNINIEGFEGQNIEAKVSAWSGPKLWVNGAPAPKGSKRGEMLLQRNDGTQAVAVWKPQAWGLDAPQLVVDGKAVNLVEPLKWYEWGWSGLPVVLVFVGGAIGAVVGLIALSINTKVFRMDLPGVLKFVIAGIVSAAAVAVYFVAAMAFSALING